MNFTKKNKRQIMELIVFAGLVLWCVFNYNLFINFIKVVFKLVMPLLVGLAIAFIIISYKCKYFNNYTFYVYE